MTPCMARRSTDNRAATQSVPEYPVTTHRQQYTTSVIGTQVEQRQQPDCDTACCGGVMPGRWTRPDPAGEPARRDYVPDAAQGCSYFPYRRAELLDKLLGEVGSLECKLGLETHACGRRLREAICAQRGVRHCACMYAAT